MAFGGGPVGQAHAAVKRLPRGQLAVFPDCGHLPHVEQPDRFATVLGTWLTGIAQARRFRGLVGA